MSLSESVDDKIRILHPDLREDAIHYIDARVKHSKRTTYGTFWFVADGTLSEFSTRYSSVDLPHEALLWRST
ncbi:MAG: hypothetical protein PHN79_06730 [Methanoregula sp.]|nr:hypothetical protein [Methanoregula sp.]